METLREFVRERAELLEEPYGLAKLVALEAFPFVWGAGLAYIGRSSGIELLPVAPVASDLFWNGQSYCSLNGIWNLSKYAVGVGVVYADRLARHL
jgi:hypothetical protein